MDCIIRKLREDEYGLLDEFLYQAIFVPPGRTAPPRSIIGRAELQVYVAAFGGNSDYALAAEVEGVVVGAVWARLMHDYGYVDDETPSLAIALLPDYRGLGLGTALLQAMLDLLRDEGYAQTSLSVEKANYAWRLYQKLGFEIVAENKEDYIMVKRLRPSCSDDEPGNRAAADEITGWHSG